MRRKTPPHFYVSACGMRSPSIRNRRQFAQRPGEIQFATCCIRINFISPCKPSTPKTPKIGGHLQIR